MNILCIGDIVGKPGRNYLKEHLAQIKEEYAVDFIVANGENAAHGTGLTKAVYEELLSLGIDVITMGNHTWSKKDILTFIDDASQLVRPANYTQDTPGVGFVIVEKCGKKIGVVNLIGRVYLDPSDSPFVKAEELMIKLTQECDVIIVDFHAEATSEKLAMGYFLDGRASIVFGTHTHVPTADERLLPKGTAYITDVGMTGPSHSILGVNREIVIKKFITNMPARFELSENPAEFGAILVTLDANCQPEKILRLSEKNIAKGGQKNVHC